MALLRTRRTRRTAAQVGGDDRALAVAKELGRTLRMARRLLGLSQAEVGRISGVAQSTVSNAENERGDSLSMRTWSRLLRAVQVDLRAYGERATAAHLPRDHVHLRSQEMVIRTAATGGWQAVPEQHLGGSGRRSVDVLLRRNQEWAAQEIWDWFDDVGDALRGWDRKLLDLEAFALGRLPVGRSPDSVRISGCWLVRATRRNRQLVADHHTLFRARFPASGKAWYRSLTTSASMPMEPGLLWLSVPGDRIFASRLG